jgi:hypothetical protein
VSKCMPRERSRLIGVVAAYEARLQAIKLRK